jgi:L-aspartate oxidase
VSCTGVQGANRLASNSLLECLVFGSRAASAALADSPTETATWATTELPEHDELPRGEYPYAAVTPAVLGARLDCDVAVERDAVRLGTLLNDMPDPNDPQLTVPTDLALSSMIAGAAFLRKESRGAHYRSDAPETDPLWRGRILWKRGVEPRFEEVVA